MHRRARMINSLHFLPQICISRSQNRATDKQFLPRSTRAYQSHVSRTSRPTHYGATPKHPSVAKPHPKNYHHHHLGDHRRGTKTMKGRTSFRSTVKARRHFGGHPKRLTETDQIG
ncbi:unnamed protein product [Ixodes pacificus]